MAKKSNSLCDNWKKVLPSAICFCACACVCVLHRDKSILLGSTMLISSKSKMEERETKSYKQTNTKQILLIDLRFISDVTLFIRVRGVFCSCVEFVFVFCSLFLLTCKPQTKCSFKSISHGEIVLETMHLFHSYHKIECSICSSDYTNTFHVH